MEQRKSEKVKLKKRLPFQGEKAEEKARKSEKIQGKEEGKKMKNEDREEMVKGR